MTRVDLSQFTSDGVRVLSGRDRGLGVRKALNVPKWDEESDSEIVFVVPSTIPFVNSSFFLGLIGDSVQELGRDRFLKKYSIEGEPRVVERFNQAVDRVLLMTSPLP